MWKKIGIATLTIVACFSTIRIMSENLEAATGDVAISGVYDVVQTRNGTSYEAANSQMYLGEYGGKTVTWEFIKTINSESAYLLMPEKAIATFAWKALDTYATSQHKVAADQMNASLSAYEKKGLAGNPTFIEVPSQTDFANGATYGMNNYYRAIMDNPPCVNVGGITMCESYPAFQETFRSSDIGYADQGYFFLTCMYPAPGNTNYGERIDRGGIGGCGLPVDDAKGYGYGFRPSAVLDKSNFVFAIDASANLGTGTRGVVQKTSKNIMKARMLDTSLNVNLSDVGVSKSGSFQSQTKFTGDTLELQYNNATARADSYISLLVKSKDTGDFMYYKVLGKSQAEGSYTIDIADWKNGKYELLIVNEVITNDDRPSVSSATSSLLIELLDPLESLSYTSQYEKVDDKLSNIYVSSDKGNTTATSILGQVGTSNGVGGATVDGVYQNGITYNVIASSDSNHKSDVNRFKIPTEADSTKPLLNNGKAYVLPVLTGSETSLPAGIYKYRIQAYDENGDPYGAQLNNGSSVSGVNPDKGLISDDITIVVFPHQDQISYTQDKNIESMYYSKKELNEFATGKVLGSLAFSMDADILKMNQAGYVIDRIQLVKKGTTTPLTELEATKKSDNLNKFDIKKKSGGIFTSGMIEFDVLITFQKDNADVAIIKKSNQSFTIPNGLSFVHPSDATFLVKNELEMSYDALVTSNNIVTLIATDKDKANQYNSQVTYCILDDTNLCTTAENSVVSLAVGGTPGTASVTLKGPGTSAKQVRMRAMIKDVDGNVTMYSDLELQVLPSKQILEWAGRNIQTKGNHITKDTTDPIQTWNLFMKYDKSVAANNEITVTALHHGKALADTHIGLTTNVVDGTGLAITYKITPSNRDDDGSVSIEDGKLKITKPLKDTVTILASGAPVGNYGASSEDDTTTAGVNEYSHAKLVISVSEKPTILFTPAFSNSIVIKGTMAEGTESLGEVGITPSTATGYLYTIKSVKKLNETTSTADDKKYDIEDSGLFAIKDTKQLFVNKPKSISKGTYVVEITGTKGSEEATSKEVSIQVSEATLDVTKLKWQYKEDTSYKDVVGNINATDGQNTEILSQVYKAGGSFFVQVDNVVGSNLLTSDDTISYALKKDSASGVVKVSTSGKVDILGASPDDSSIIIEASITKDGYGTSNVSIPIKIEKAEVNLQFINKNGTLYDQLHTSDKTKYKTQSLVYAPDMGIDVFTNNAPSGVDVTLSIVSTASTKNDVLGFKADEATANENTATKTCSIAKEDYSTQYKSKCQAQVLNAQKIAGDNGKVILKASVPESANNQAMSIEMPINISQAEQSGFDFALPDITVESNLDGAFDPVFTSTKGTGLIMLSVSNLDSGADSDFTNEELELDYDGATIENEEFYVDGVSGYRYHILASVEEGERTGRIYARKGSDRNYKASSLKASTLHVLPEGASVFKTTLVSYPSGVKNKLTYGDAYFTIESKSDEDDPDNKPTYTYEIDASATDYIALKDGGEANEFVILKATSADSRGRIKVTRIDPSGSTTTSTVSFVINKLQVKAQVESISKKVGMKVAANELKFTSASDAFLLADKDKINQAIFTSKNADAEELVDIAGVTLQENNQVISASYEANPILNNYQFVNVTNPRTLGIESGKLSVTQDASEPSWIEVKAAVDTTLGSDGWYNGDVEVLLKKIAGSYDQISQDQIMWESDTLIISKEGQHNVDLYVRQSEGIEEGAIASPQTKEIKIDKTKPVIKTVTGDKVNDNGMAKFMNAATFGTFFKPGVEVVVQSEDTNVDPTLNVSGIDTIQYRAYAKDGDSFIKLTDGDMTLNGSVGKIVLSDPGIYRICASAKDKAGNISDEYCSELTVKKIDIDVDGDGKLDFNDIDKDGCPDINIVLGKDEKNKWIKLNVDRNEDGIPDLNIDSIGDGKADINVDTDGDGRPDLNLRNLSEWTPTVCVSSQIDEYCTMPNIKAALNIDINRDGIPDINIDSDGNGISDYNTDIDMDSEEALVDRKAEINLGPVLSKWVPDKDASIPNFTFDTMSGLEAVLNIDTDEDGRADINLDRDHDGIPELNVDISGDSIPDINIDSSGASEGSPPDGIPDINISPNGDGIITGVHTAITAWNPDKDVDLADGKLQYDTMSGIVVEKDKQELEDNNVSIEKPNGGPFLPNYALKVDDITASISNPDKEKIIEVLGKNEEIKQIFNLMLMKDNLQTQPDGLMKVKIPVVAGLKNPKLVIIQKDGSQKVLQATEENGFYIYETDFLGVVSVIGDKIEEEKPPVEEIPPVKEEIPPVKEEIEVPDVKEPVNKVPEPSVKGEYAGNIGNSMGGATTGDDTIVVVYVVSLAITMGLFAFMIYRRKKAKD